MMVLLGCTPKLILIQRCSMHCIRIGKGLTNDRSDIFIILSIMSQIFKEIPNSIGSLRKLAS